MSQKSITVNSIYNIILKIFQLVVPILVGPYVAYILDVNLYGVYNTALSQIDFFMIFAIFGVNVYGIREISKVRNDEYKKNQVFTNLFIISLITSTLSFLLFIIYIFFFVDSNSSLVYYVLSLKIIVNIFMVEWVNEATENYRFITIKTIIVRIINVFGLFLFVRKPDDIVNYAILVTVCTFLNNILSYIYIRKYFKFNLKSIQLKKYLLPLLNILIISNINLFYTQFDKLLLGFFNSEVSVSFYYLPQNIIGIITTVLTAMIMVSISRLAYYNANDLEDNYNELLFKMYRNFMIIVFPACIGIFCLSKEIMYLYGSNKYIGAHIVLAIFAIRTIGSSLYTVYANQILYIKGKEKVLLKYLVIGAILNIIFNLTLIFTRLFTPETAIFTTFLSEIVILILMNRYIRNVLNINIRLLDEKNKKYLFISLLFLPITILVNSFGFSYIMNVVIIVPACIVLYFSALLVIKDEIFIALLRRFIFKIKHKFKK